jgi:hypothetical protein
VIPRRKYSTMRHEIRYAQLQSHAPMQQRAATDAAELLQLCNRCRHMDRRTCCERMERERRARAAHASVHHSRFIQDEPRLRRRRGE